MRDNNITKVVYLDEYRLLSQLKKNFSRNRTPLFMSYKTGKISNLSNDFNKIQKSLTRIEYLLKEIEEIRDS